jgi:hypothetical protein
MMPKTAALVRQAAKSVIAARISASLPGIAGMALLALGAAFVYLPAGLIVAGALLLRVDANL